MKQRAGRLEDWFKRKKSTIVAFSGGVDSSVLAKAAFDALGDKAIAVTFDSPIVARSELENAKEVAREIGIRHEIVQIEVLNVPGFKENPRERCYLCKRAISLELKRFGEKIGIDCIVEGSNASDAGMHRPGMRALEEAGIRSPLMELGFEKEWVRELARLLGLSVQDRPETACLATRIPFGDEITLERLRQIEEGEEILREMGFRQVRLRQHGKIARIEVGKEELEGAFAAREEISKALKSLGFEYITLDLEGYRTGSMEETS